MVQSGLTSLGPDRRKIRLSNDETGGHAIGERGHELKHPIIPAVHNPQITRLIENKPLGLAHSARARGTGSAKEVSLSEDDAGAHAGAEGSLIVEHPAIV